MAELLPWIGAITTLVAAVLGGYAAVKARQVEGRSATREETQQALNAQNALLDRYEKRITAQDERAEAQDAKILTLEKAVEDGALERQKILIAHRQCERDLEDIRLKMEGKL